MKIKSKLIYLIRIIVVPIVGWRAWNYFRFIFVHKYVPRISKPRTFLEFLIWGKYLGRMDRLGIYVDKIAVKEYVRSVCSDVVVIPTLCSLYSSEDECLLSDLGDNWIAKGAHTSGFSYICPVGGYDNSFKKFCSNVLSIDYYNKTGESNYRYIVPAVIVEPLICSRNFNLIDYKVWCFAGEPRFIGIHGDRSTNPKGQIFELNGSPSKWIYPDIPSWSGSAPFPKNFDRILSIARKLSSAFSFVRVDLYEINDDVVFGELTFSPGDGFNIRIPYEEDLQYGELIICSKPNIFRDVGAV